MAAACGVQNVGDEATKNDQQLRTFGKTIPVAK
jgi:hypothetical protein